MNTRLTEKKTNNILESFKFDITSYFNNEYQIVSTEDSPAIQIVDYETKLSELEFDVFDTLHLMVMFDKFFITSDTHINASFRCKNREISDEEIKKITNYFHDLYGSDDSTCKKWTKTDNKRLKDFSFNRIWPTGMGDSFLKLGYKKNTGFEVSILFLNNLLENQGMKIHFN